jgi:hypothetical protein
MTRESLSMCLSFVLGVLLVSTINAVAHEESECAPCPPCETHTVETQQETVDAVKKALEAIKKAEIEEQ